MIFKKAQAERFVKFLENPDAVTYFIEQLADDSSEKKKD
jgi:uncharacterized protein (DUF1778 family)